MANAPDDRAWRLPYPSAEYTTWSMSDGVRRQRVGRISRAPQARRFARAKTAGSPVKIGR